MINVISPITQNGLSLKLVSLRDWAREESHMT